MIHKIENKNNIKLKSKFNFFVQCLPKLEPIVAKEIQNLGLKCFISNEGGVYVRGNILDLYRLNLWLRCANRILIRIKSFYINNFKKIIKKLISYPWEIYLNKTNTIIIKTTCKKTKVYHGKTIAQQIIFAIEKRLGYKIYLLKPSEKLDNTQIIYVRIIDNNCTISIDSSGAHLHERWYHTQKVKAPIRETIAAAIVYLSNWDYKEILWDPFCGSGTILIEAALIALNIAPGLNRKFAFMDWKNFDEELFYAIERQKQPFNRQPKIIGSDISEKAINCAISNAQNAKVNNIITFKQQNFFKTIPVYSSGFIITNPPYGKRLNIDSAFYKRLRKHIEKNFLDWNISILCPPKIKSIFSTLSFKEMITLYNGGIPISLLNKKSNP